MTTDQITINVAPDVARAYREANDEDRRTLDVLLSLRLSEALRSERPLGVGTRLGEQPDPPVAPGQRLLQAGPRERLTTELGGDPSRALVEDLVMPLVSSVLPGGDWRQYTVTPLKIQLGHLLGSIVDFFLVALVLFIVVVKVMGALDKPDAPAAPTTKQCPECLETVPLKARRCRACTAQLAA